MLKFQSRRLQTKILKQQQVHILQSQVTKVISTTDSLAKGFVKLDQSNQDNDNEIRASLDPAATLDYYHGTLARQELIYTDITNLEVDPALAALYSYKVTQPSINLADLALAAGTKVPQEAKEEVKVEQPTTTPKPKKGKETQKSEKTEKKEVVGKGGKRAKSNDRKEAEESKKATRKSSKETSGKPSGQRKKSK